MLWEVRKKLRLQNSDSMILAEGSHTEDHYCFVFVLLGISFQLFGLLMCLFRYNLASKIN